MKKLLVVLAVLAGFVLSGCIGDDDMTHISTLEQLQAMKDNLSEDYILDNDIDASATSGWNEGLGFDPIGDWNTGFSGSFDGQNHSITGLYINRTEEQPVGLFGYVLAGANIKDVVLSDVDIKGYYAGGIAGDCKANVTNCHVIGDVRMSSLDSYYIGGLIGWSGENTISQCSSEGTAEGISPGGLIGRAKEVTVSKCHSKSNVIVYDAAFSGGGLIGFAYQNSVISNSYAKGSVSEAVDYCRGGGLIGYVRDSSVSNCYSTGNISTFNAGGLLGKSLDITIFNSFWDTETSGCATSEGGIGKTTEQMKTKSTFTDWDFDTIWRICEAPDYVVTYPWLQWEGIECEVFDKEAPWKEDTLEVGGGAEVEIPRRSGEWTTLEDIIRIHTSRGKDTSSPRAPIEIAQAEITCSNISKKFNSFEEASEWFKSLVGYAVRIWVSWD